MNVLSGLCVSGPRAGATLATMHGRKVGHPDDPGGFYVHKPASGVTPSQWLWVKNKEQTK